MINSFLNWIAIFKVTELLISFIKWNETFLSFHDFYIFEIFNLESTF